MNVNVAGIDWGDANIPFDGGVIGFDFGRSNFRVAFTDSYGRILTGTQVSGEEWQEILKRSYEDILSAMYEAMRAVVNKTGRPFSAVRAVGGCLPGPLWPDAGKGEMGTPPGLRVLWNRPIGDDISRDLQVPVAIANDADCHGLTICYFKLTTDYLRHTVCGWALGSGTGFWRLEGGKLFRGRGMAPDDGHRSLDPGGPLCRCGARGCPEATVSGYGLVNLFNNLAKGSGFVIHDAAELPVLIEQGSELANAVVRAAGKCLGRMFAGTIISYQPKAIIVSGSLVKLGDSFIDAAKDELSLLACGSVVLGTMFPGTEIKVVELDEHAAAWGAAHLALDLANAASWDAKNLENMKKGGVE